MTVRVFFFAYLRERCGVRERSLDLAEGSSVGDLWRTLVAQHPDLEGAGLRFAVNQVYVDKAHPLRDNDDVALIPPVSGGVPNRPRTLVTATRPSPARQQPTAAYRIVDGPIDTMDLLDAVGSASAGGTVLFVGTTRDHNDGREVVKLEYEAYRAMALREMERIGEHIVARWPVVAVAMVHRIGEVPIGEASVAVAVSAAHRDTAFAACRYGIDTLKATVPIWKKEFYRDGSRWVGACDHHGAAPIEGGE